MCIYGQGCGGSPACSIEGRTNVSQPTDRELVSAVNLIADFTCKNLPPEWSIQLNFYNNDCFAILFDSDGNDVEVDSDGCLLRSMVNHARETAGLSPVGGTLS